MKHRASKETSKDEESRIAPSAFFEATRVGSYSSLKREQNRRLQHAKDNRRFANSKELVERPRTFRTLLTLS